MSSLSRPATAKRKLYSPGSQGNNAAQDRPPTALSSSSTKPSSLPGSRPRTATARPASAFIPRSGPGAPATKATRVSSGSAMPPRPNSAMSLPGTLEPGARDQIARHNSPTENLHNVHAQLDNSMLSGTASEQRAHKTATACGEVWLSQLISLMRSVNKWQVSLDPVAVCKAVRSKACALTQAESAGIFLVDFAKEEVVLQSAPMVNNQPTKDQTPTDTQNMVKVPFGKGIIGNVATDGETVNVRNIQQDLLYLADFDSLVTLGGKDTPPRNAIYVPWRDGMGELVAIIQVVNKKGGGLFSVEDEVMLQLLGMQVAAVLRCSDLHLRFTDAKEQQGKSTNPQKDQALSEAIAELNDVVGGSVEELVKKATNQLSRLSDADQGTVFFANESTNEMWTISEAEDQLGRVTLKPSTDTTAGFSYLRMQSLNIPNIYEDPRFNDGLTAAGVGLNDTFEGLPPEKCCIYCVPLLLDLKEYKAKTISDGAATELNISADGEIEKFNVDSSGWSSFWKPQAPLGVIEIIKREEVTAQEISIVEQYCQQLARKIVEIRGKARNELLERCCTDLISSQDKDEVLVQAIKAVAMTTRASSVGVYPVDVESNELMVPQTEDDGTGVYRRMTFKECGIAGYVAEHQKVVNLSDVKDSKLDDGSVHQSSLPGGVADPVSYLCVPVFGHRNRDLHEGKEMESSSTPTERQEQVVVAVLFAYNKKYGPTQHQDWTREELVQFKQFHGIDETAMVKIASQLGRVLSRESAYDLDKKTNASFARMIKRLPQLFREFDLRRLLRVTADDICHIIGAEHCTCYVVDHHTNEVWTQVEGFRREVRLPKSQGIVGSVATSGSTVRIRNAEEAKAIIGSAADALTGGVVQSMICAPVLGSQGDVIAVLQPFHAQKNAFSDQDEQNLNFYCRLLSVALENQRMIINKSRDVMRGIPIEWERDRVHKSLAQCVKHQLDCEKAVIFEVVSPWDKLLALSRDGTEFLEFPIKQGIVGSVFTSGNAVMSDHVKMLPLFDEEIDQQTLKEPRSYLCTPMYDSGSGCMGVVVAYNKKKYSFNRTDEAMLKALSTQFGEILSSRYKYFVAKGSVEDQGFFIKSFQTVAGVTELSALLKAVSKLVLNLIPGKLCTVFKHEKENSILFTFDADGGEVRVPVSKNSVGGFACQNAQVLRIDDVYQDPRFNKFTKKISEEDQTAMLCCPVKRGNDVLGIIQCLRSDGDKFTLEEEQRIVNFAAQVALPAFHTYFQNRPAYRIFKLVDDFCTMSSEVQSKTSLYQNIKEVVGRALACEKINLYTVDVMRQELVLDMATDFWDEIDFLEKQLKSVANRSRLPAGHHDYVDNDQKIKMEENFLMRLKVAKQQQLKMMGSVYRLPFGKGIVGKVAETGGFYITSDATKDQLLECEASSILARPTKTMLCHCAYNASGDMVGVIQAINKQHGVFTQEDEFLLERLSGQAGVMLYHHAALSRLDKSSRARFQLCEYAVRVLSCTDELRIIHLVAEHGTQLIDSRKCALWVHDADRKCMWTVDERKEIKAVPIRELATTVVGRAAISCETQIQGLDDDSGADGANAPQPAASDKDVKENEGDLASGLISETAFRSGMLGQPVLGKKQIGQLLAVIECVSKRGGVFDEEDKYVMELFSTITSSAMENIKSLAEKEKPLQADPQITAQSTGAVRSSRRVSHHGT